MHQGVVHEGFFIPAHGCQYLADFRNYNQSEAVVTISKFHPNPNFPKFIHFVILHLGHSHP